MRMHWCFCMSIDWMRQKNQTILLEVFRNLKALYPKRKMELLMVGDGELRDALMEQAKVTDIEKWAHFCGIRKDANRFYSAADMFVFPSYFEGLSLTMVEAQASGIPILASNKMDEESFFAENTRQMPLSAPMEAWAHLLVQIEQQYGGGRKEADNPSRAKMVREAGFDIEMEKAPCSNI